MQAVSKLFDDMNIVSSVAAEAMDVQNGFHCIKFRGRSQPRASTHNVSDEA